MKKLLLIFITFLFAGDLAASSDPANIKILSGKVVDKQSGEALAGAKIQLKDTDKYCYTDLEGNFTLTVSTTATDVVTIDLIGYETSTLKTYELSLGSDISLTSR